MTVSEPDQQGHFGQFGGRFVPETLIPVLEELTAAYEFARKDAEFQGQLADLFKRYVGRPTPLYYAERLTEHAGGAKIYLKREDLAHTGAHKINNVLGQILLARQMGKERVIAPSSASPARCTWARRTCGGRPSTSSA
jgi:tryptophan synthase beta chain